MKKLLMLATAAFLVTGVAFAGDGKEKKECNKDKKACCKKSSKKCCKKDKEKKEEKAEEKKAD